MPVNSYECLFLLDPTKSSDLEAVKTQRDRIAVLFARLLEDAGFMVSGYGELRRWVGLAEKDATLREPIARFLTGVIEQTEDSSSIRFYLDNWSGPRTGQTEAARAILAHLDRKGL